MFDPNAALIGILSIISDGITMLSSIKLHLMIKSFTGDPSGTVLDVND
jgi:hypothetical protein